MNTYIALFRGINVGGKNKLPMKDLKRMLEAEGCVDVRTYIQSGNAIFRSRHAGDRLGNRLTAAVAREHGFEPRVLICSVSELEKAAGANPFAEAEADPGRVHLFFLDEKPKKPDWSAFDAIKSSTERYALKDRHFYLYTPDGFGTSKLAARAEKLLGVAATARNWRTVTTLLGLAREYR